MEMDRIRGHFSSHRNPSLKPALQRVGFGPITSAARAGALIARYRPSRVILVGIGGTFDVERFPGGSACRFDQVVCDGVGMGRGDQFCSAEDQGWKQFAADDAMPEVRDVLPLVSTYDPSIPCAGTLLTVCAASANAQDRKDRLVRYPEACVEDMEGFAVAAACTMASVPVQIVRGISNQVGDRDHGSWQIEPALAAAASMALALLGRRWMPSIA